MFLHLLMILFGDNYHLKCTKKTHFLDLDESTIQPFLGTAEQQWILPLEVKTI